MLHLPCRRGKNHRAKIYLYTIIQYFREGLYLLYNAEWTSQSLHCTVYSHQIKAQVIVQWQILYHPVRQLHRVTRQPLRYIGWIPSVQFFLHILYYHFLFHIEIKGHYNGIKYMITNPLLKWNKTVSPKFSLQKNDNLLSTWIINRTRKIIIDANNYNCINYCLGIHQTHTGSYILYTHGGHHVK